MRDLRSIRVFGFLYFLFAFHAFGSTVENSSDVIWLAQKAAGVQSEVHFSNSFEKLISKPGAWADPKIHFNYSNMPVTSPWLGNSGMSGIQVGISQTFPSLGSNKANIQVAKAFASQKKHESDARINHYVARAIELYHRLGAQEALIQITKNHIKSLKRLEKVVAEKYRVGQGMQYQLLQTKLMVETLAQKLGDLNSKGSFFFASLNGMLERTESAAIQSDGFRSVQPVESELDVAIANPTLNGIFAKKRTEDRRVSAFEKELFPRVTASFAYRFRKELPGMDDGTDFISLGLTIPFTFIWNSKRYGSQIRAAKLRRHSAELSHRQEEQNIHAKLRGLISELKQSDSKILAYKDRILPLSRQSQASTLKAYQVNNAQYADIYAAELEIIKAEREEIWALLKSKLIQNKIDALVGAYIIEVPS